MTRLDPLLMARIGLAVSAGLPQRQAGGHVVLVTSPVLGGAQLVSELLAQELATRLGGDVVLVDAMARDAAEPGKDARKKGLADLMASGVVDAKRLRGPDATGLFRMTAGASARRDVFFHADAVTNALGALRARFKLSVVNGPTLEECGALIQQADKVLLAIDAQAASPRAVRRAMAHAQIDPAVIDGAILTNACGSPPAWLPSE